MTLSYGTIFCRFMFMRHVDGLGDVRCAPLSPPMRSMLIKWSIWKWEDERNWEAAVSRHCNSVFKGHNVSLTTYTLDTCVMSEMTNGAQNYGRWQYLSTLSRFLKVANVDTLRMSRGAQTVSCRRPVIQNARLASCRPVRGRLDICLNCVANDCKFSASQFRDNSGPKT